MRLFTELYDSLDATTRTSEKEAALERYFLAAPAEDAAWALAILTGRRPRRAATHTQLRAWASELSGLPPWLIDECYERVGDLSETLALLLPGEGEAHALPFHRLVEERLLPLSRAGEIERRALMVRTWAELSPRERFVFHKLISGSFRVGVARKLVVRAIAKVAGIEAGVMDHRMLGEWKPTGDEYRRLLSAEGVADDPARPYPFFLASQLDDPPATLLGDFGAWLAEWKWDGIRAQLIRRPGVAMLWTRGEESATESFPELRDVARLLPEGTVLDGEVLAWEGNSGKWKVESGNGEGSGRPLSFGVLQRRLNRKNVVPTLFPEAPIVFMVYDVLEEGGRDVRGLSLLERRSALEALVRRADDPTLIISECIAARSWEDLGAKRAASRELGVEGIMLKRLSSVYGVGRTRGDWWKWKIEPHTIDAVLIMAQPGTGRRAGLLTDYTFGVWDGGKLVTIAKAYSGLTDEEIRAVDARLLASTVEKHGPVRIVKPEMVFELAFEGVQESERHRAGLAVRFPRINRWRQDKKASEADSLDRLRALLRGGKLES